MIIFLTKGYLSHFIHNNVVIYVDTSMKMVELSIDIFF